MLLVVAAVYAPYLPRLIFEGYPGLDWPAAGHFAPVRGQLTPEPATQNVTLDPELQQQFEDKDGRAIIASRDGKVVLEHYAPGTSRETRLNSYSMIKSLVGILVLKAIAEKRIGSLETPIGDLLPELPAEPSGRSLRELPLCRVLDMRSGISFQPDPAKSAAGFAPKDFETTKINIFGPMARLHMGGLTSVRDRLIASNAEIDDKSCRHGSYSYQNANTALLGAVLEKVYAKPLEIILSDKIWQPAGAHEADWRRYGEALPVTPYCCLYARPLDWLRVAEFLLNNGTPIAPFLPDDLWRQFMGLDVPTWQISGGYYRHHLYHNVLDRPGETLVGPFAYFMGRGGQTTYLMPANRIAVVRFGGKIQKLHSTLYGVGRTIFAKPPASPE